MTFTFPISLPDLRLPVEAQQHLQGTLGEISTWPQAFVGFQQKGTPEPRKDDTDYFGGLHIFPLDPLHRDLFKGSLNFKIFIPHPPHLSVPLPVLEALSCLPPIFDHTFRVLSPMEKKPLVGFASAITVLESENCLLSRSPEMICTVLGPLPECLRGTVLVSQR